MFFFSQFSFRPSFHALWWHVTHAYSVIGPELHYASITVTRWDQLKTPATQHTRCLSMNSFSSWALRGCCYSCCCYVLMDRSANCRSQIASSHAAPLHGNSKRCIRRRRHRRNPAPLASGNEILFVGGWSVEPGLQLPGGDRQLGQGRRRRACAAGEQRPPAAELWAGGSDERSDDVLTSRRCLVSRVANYSDKRQNESS